MDAVEASRAAINLLGKAVVGQSTVIAFDTAFNAVALLFIVAAPILVTIKLGLSRHAISRDGTPETKLPPACLP
jgi:DHA2 family multidrug resistance protein